MTQHNALNSERLKVAFDMLCEALKESLARADNGRVSLTLHVIRGMIVKPEIERTEYPAF